MWDSLTVMDLVGVIGSLLICAAYLLVSVGRVDAEGVRYQLTNAAGAILLLASLWFRPNPGAIVIEALWLAIAAIGLGRALLKRR